MFEILKNGDRVDTWKRLDDAELTIVGQQTLFEGPKAHHGDSSSSPSSGSQGRLNNGSNQKGQRQRQIDDLLERLRQGSQVVMGGFGGGAM